ncbi:hypothetical protein DB347_05140 [Opitutaceae bacterium EW11]|nr:hypothetical protein DB347_05140 [Opitutaceae bacterium EW11]
MSESREAIFSRIRGALQPLHDRAPYPEYPDNVATLAGAGAAADLWTAFKVRTQLVNGLAFDNVAALVDWLREKKHLRGYCDPALWAEIGGSFGDDFHVERVFDRSQIDTYQFGITHAAGALAETGSVILKDATTASRLAALAPWVHIAVLKREQIFPDVAAAVRSLGSDPNVIWCTGPSKTADVEGILIQGVHGPGVQITVLA